MAFPNTTDIVTTTIESRSKEVADNVRHNNALLTYLEKEGKTRPVTGGSVIFENFAYQANANAAWYSGYDTFSTATADVLSSYQFTLKQIACPVVISGQEELENSGTEAMLSLIDERIAVAESSMANIMSTGVYSDGTGSGGKQIVGIAAFDNDTPTSGTYGGVDRSLWTAAQNQEYDLTTAATASNIQAAMNSLWGSCVRGKDHPKLIVMPFTVWGPFLASMQSLQRFTDPKLAELGFENMRYMMADVMLDGGIGGDAVANEAYFLNTDYLYFRPHKDRNMVPLSPNKRAPINQDATIQILAWAGALTGNGVQFHGYLECK